LSWGVQVKQGKILFEEKHVLKRILSINFSSLDEIITLLSVRVPQVHRLFFGLLIRSSFLKAVGGSSCHCKSKRGLGYSSQLFD
jgi:hypothetical protein